MTVSRLGNWELTLMALRASLLQATWNYERQQGLGWAFSLKPALDRLYPDAATRRERLAEHTAYFNTQPSLASVALGAVAALEEQRAAGAAAGPPLDAGAMSRIKGALGASLAAVGDRLFWFTLRPFAACLGIGLALSGSWRGAAALLIAYNLVHLLVRFRGVHWGYREGPAVLTGGLRDQLGALIQRLGWMGTALCGVVMAMMLVPGGQPRTVAFQVLLVAGLSLGLVVGSRPRPTPTQWALGLGGLSLAAVWWR